MYNLHLRAENCEGSSSGDRAVWNLTEDSRESVYTQVIGGDEVVSFEMDDIESSLLGLAVFSREKQLGILTLPTKYLQPNFVVHQTVKLYLHECHCWKEEVALTLHLCNNQAAPFDGIEGDLKADLVYEVHEDLSDSSDNESSIPEVDISSC